MITTEKCRRIIGDPTISDIEIESIRETLYSLAFASFDEYSVRQSNSNEGPRECEPEIVDRFQFNRALEIAPTTARQEIEERAAIKEFEAEMNRDEAERSAIQEYIVRQKL